MCAIAGFYSDNKSFEVLADMLAKMETRGPDASYTYHNFGFYAGMNRLSINDVEHGEQPFKNHDSSIMVFFNGEIYNYPQLKIELESDGVMFKTHCDGEILPYLFIKYGIDFLNKLDGMFGICIYDKNKRQILLARDIMGEKPLYYVKTPNSFAFSTLIAPLCLQDSTINPRAIWDFLTFGFIPEPQTIFDNIQALPKGTYGVYDINRAEFFIQSFIKQTQRNFSIEFENTDDSLLRITKQIVQESIFDRLLSDVKVGAFLSGGLDSSIVVSIAKQRCATLETFNIAFADNVDPYCGFADESEFAQIIAKHVGLNHHEIRVDSKNYQDYLQDFIASIDQPYGAISGIGIKMIARFARELGIKVLLSGDGADEMFGGYAWYPKLQFNDPRYITQEKPKGWHYYAFESEKRAFLSKDMFSFGGNYFESLHYFPASSSPIDSIQFDRNFYLPFEMMTKLDRMTMSEGVEGRACFVSPKIFAFIQQLDYQSLLRHGTKWLLRESFRDILPQKIVMREKHGFNPPIDYWLHHAWRPLLLEAFAPQSALNRLGILSTNVEQDFMPIFDKSERRFGNIAFFLVVLNLWLEQHINSRNIAR